MEIKFKRDFKFNNKYYFKNDFLLEEDLTEDNLKEIWSLNEKGIIYPISIKLFSKLSNEIKNKKEIYEIGGE